LFRKGTVKRMTNDGGERVTSVVGQWIDKRTKKIDLLRFYVTDDDCAAGFGLVTLVDMQGKYVTSSDMALGGESIGSHLADVICSVRETSSPTPQSQPQQGDTFNPNKI
jgi:hypothetical protein